MLLSFLFPSCQAGLDTKVQKSRKQIKERKNRSKKIRGVKKVRTPPPPGLEEVWLSSPGVQYLRGSMYCTVLYCTVLYCTVWYCSVT